MAQKPIAMEHIKQLLQLQKDGVGIREMARRVGTSRNSVRKYLLLVSTGLPADGEQADNRMLAEKAYNNDSIAHDAQRLQDVITHFQYAQGEMGRTGVTRNFSGRSISATIRMAMLIANTVTILVSF